MTASYADIIQKRRDFSIAGFKTLADAGFDGPWVTPYQITSCSRTGPVLVALHWLDDDSIDKNRAILSRLGYLPDIRFNKVLDIALQSRKLTRADIYVTQAFHLVPKSRSQKISTSHLMQSFAAITSYEIDGRKVLALGSDAALVCRAFGADHVATCHPSRRGHKNEINAGEIAEGLKQLGF